ncbi:hypothetical protein [Streptomyces sp. NBC_00212]|uniref:hypothetical protein n=1 Tax=Streptomyces sp. NBC_00212 TaxID=2975684 RepID=UPI0032484DB9
MANHQVLHARWAPRDYDGTMRLYVAGRSEEAASGTDPARRWKPYFSGPLDVHVIDSNHDDLLNPGPLDEIGPDLAAELDRLHRDQDGRAQR